MRLLDFDYSLPTSKRLFGTITDGAETAKKFIMELDSVTLDQSIYCTPRITLEGRLTDTPTAFRYNTSLKAKKVIHHNPATIVLWEDGTKTVVKCGSKDEYNPMLGLALCYMKKALGNSSRKFNDALHANGF